MFSYKSNKSFFNEILSIKITYNLSFNNILLETQPEYPPWRLPTANICNELKQIRKNRYSQEQLKAIYLDHQQGHGDSFVVYTDGSKTDEGVAYSIITQDQTISNKIPSTATVFTSEILAIKQALEEHRDQPNITICSDSKSAIQAICCYQHKNPIIRQIQQSLYHLPQTRLCWVPSHIGVQGNERADAAARNATTMNETTPTPLPKSDHKCAIKASTFSKWKEKWNRTGDNKLRTIQHTLTKILPRGRHIRRWEVILARLRIGHTRMTHKYLMERQEPPQCELCGDHLTVPHILTNCDGLRAERRRIFGRRTPSLEEMLKEHSAFNGKLFKYLSETNLIREI